MQNPKNILVFGTNSDIGSYLCPQLIADGWNIDTVTMRKPRNNHANGIRSFLPSDYRKLVTTNKVKVSTAISLMPIWELSNYKDILEAIGVTRLIALSSTSLLSKVNSTNRKEQLIATQLRKGEEWINHYFTI